MVTWEGREGNNSGDDGDAKKEKEKVVSDRRMQGEINYVCDQVIIQRL